MRGRFGITALATLAACTTAPEPALAAPAPYFYLDNAATNEDNGCIPITAHRIGSNGKSSTLRVVLRSGTALSGEDFIGSSYNFVFGPSDKSATRCADLVDDQWKEVTENFTAVARPVHNARIYDDGTAFLQIADSDTATNQQAQPLPPPVVPPPVVTPPGDPAPPATQTCWDGSVILATLQCPVQPPPSEEEPPPPPDPDPPAPPPDVPSPTIAGVTAIASNFDTTTHYINVSVPKSAAPDVVGAFRFTCKPGQLLRDDPIVYPGTEGAAHGHQFFGNMGANADSTYESLRTTGESSCVNKLNRSGYWMPWLQDNTHVYKPDHVQIYYKRRPASDPKCTRANAGSEGDCTPLPRGLKFIFGYDMVTGSAPTGSFYFMCSSGTVSSPNSAHQPTIAAVFAYCPTGARFSVSGKAPGCWNGLHIDSQNHRSHVAYAVRNNNTGITACPSTHPYVIAGFTITAIWPITQEMKDAATAGVLRFSSDDAVPTAAHGTTFHSDWWGAWDEEAQRKWEVEGCINLMLNCASGDTGTGKMLKNMISTSEFPAGTIRVPIP